MKRMSFLALGLSIAASLFGAEAPTNAQSEQDKKQGQHTITNQAAQMQHICSIAARLMRRGPDAQKKQDLFNDLCAQPIVQLTLLSLADLLQVDNADAADIVRAPFSERQRKNTTRELEKHAITLFKFLAEGDKERGAAELRATIHVMAQASHLRTQWMSKKSNDCVVHGCFLFNFPVTGADWGDIVHICAAAQVCKHEHFCSEWIPDLASKPLSQMILWSAAMGSLSTAPDRSAIMYHVLPKQEGVKRAHLATAIAHAHLNNAKSDDYHTWIQRAIVDAGSWASMLDMQEHREEFDKKASLYWYAQAERAGWRAEPQKMLDWYAEINRQEAEEREHKRKKREEVTLLLTKSQEKEKEKTDPIEMVRIDFKRDIEQILDYEINEGYAPEDDQADPVAREVTEDEIHLSNLETMRNMLENENEGSEKFTLIKLNVMPE